MDAQAGQDRVVHEQGMLLLVFGLVLLGAVGMLFVLG